MISFRLTEEEYGKCRQLCFNQGLRSVSEMARAALSLLLQHPDRVPQEALENRVAELEGRIHILALELKRLNHRHPLDPAPPLSRARTKPSLD